MSLYFEAPNSNRIGCFCSDKDFRCGFLLNKCYNENQRDIISMH